MTTARQTLEDAINHLVQEVMIFKSEEWDSLSLGITKEEAERIAAQLIYRHLINEEGVSHISGCDIEVAHDLS